MKLLRVIGSMDPASGGPCQGLRNIIPELYNLKVYNEVVSLDNPNSEYLGMDDFKIHALGPTKTPWKYTPKLIPWLLENASDFDAIIVHGLWNYHAYAVRKVLKIIRSRSAAERHKIAPVPRLYVMPHGMLDPWFQVAEERKWKAIRNWLYWKLIEHRVVNDADGVLFTCDQEMMLARSTFTPYHPKRELNVGYGISEPPAYSKETIESFYQRFPELRDKPYLLYLGRIHPKKGIDDLISAYRMLLNDRDPLPMLVIAGPDGDTGYFKKVVAMAEDQQNIVFTGMLMGDMKWGALHAAQAFILPSHQENFGISVVEAMACSKPVLITNQVNIWKEIQISDSGIVDCDTPDGITRMLRRWCQMSAMQQKTMANNAIRAYHTYFNIKSTSVQFLSAICSAQTNE